MDNRFKKFIVDIHDSSTLESINKCAGKDIVAEKNLKHLTNEVLGKIKDMLFTKVIYDEFFNDSRLLIIEGHQKIKVQVNLGNFCLHGCAHCIIDGNCNGSELDIATFSEIIKKYSSKMKYVDCFFFTGGELLDREDFPLFIEEVLKRGVERIRFASRGGLAHQPKNVRELIRLKNRYPGFDMELSLSMDNYSEENNRKQNKHLDRLVELIDMQFEVFRKDHVDFISTIPFDDKEEADNEFYIIKRKINRICNRMKKSGYEFKGHKLIDGYDNFYFEKNGRRFELSFVYQMLIGGTEKGRGIRGSGKPLSREDACRYLDFRENSTFYVDDNATLNYCSSIAHGMNKDKSVLSLLTAPRNEVIKAFFETKRRFYASLSADQIVDYVLNPEDKLLCSNLRKDLKLT